MKIALSTFFIVILCLASISASDVRLNTDRAAQERWLAEVNTLLCAKVNVCNGTFRDSPNHPYAYIYICCVPDERDRNRFDCSDSCRTQTQGVIAHFYYSGLTPHEAVDIIIALKTVPWGAWAFISNSPVGLAEALAKTTYVAPIP